MTKKDFFRIIIKLFGLYWLISALFSTGQFYFLSFIPGFTVPAILMAMLIFLVLLILFYMLIIKTDVLIEWFKLDKGFDNDLIEFHQFDLDNIAVFLNQSYLAFKVQTSIVYDLTGLNGYSTYHLAVSFTKIILGYLLLTNYPALSKILLKITQKKED